MLHSKSIEKGIPKDAFLKRLFTYNINVRVRQYPIDVCKRQKIKLGALHRFVQEYQSN